VASQFPERPSLSSILLRVLTHLSLLKRVLVILHTHTYREEVVSHTLRHFSFAQGYALLKHESGEASLLSLIYVCIKVLGRFERFVNIL
jgi:hypothetical protein